MAHFVGGPTIEIFFIGRKLRLLRNVRFEKVIFYQFRFVKRHIIQLL